MQTRNWLNIRMGLPVWTTIAMLALLIFSVSVSAQESVTVDKIVNHPDQYLGKTVTLQTEMGEVYGSNVAAIENKEFFNKRKMLVVSSSPLQEIVPKPISEENKVQLTGEVRMFNADELKQEFGITLSQDVQDKFKDKPVLIIKKQVVEQKAQIEQQPAEITPTAKVENQETLPAAQPAKRERLAKE